MTATGAGDLARINTGPAHQVAVYLVTVLSVDDSAGTCSVDPGDGETLDEAPFYGTPTVDTTTIMLLFDGQLAVLGLPST
jgi:hypothetical protein